MIKFYLNNEEIKVRVYPQIVETQDETLDTLSIVLEANNTKDPYAPHQIVKVEIDGTIKHIFKLMSDNVSIFSTAPMRYTHTLQLIQNIKYLELHILRNSVFSQPANNIRKFYVSRTEGLYYSSLSQTYYYQGYPATGDAHTSGVNSQFWVDDLVLNRKEKVKSAKMRAKIYEVDSENNIVLSDGRVSLSSESISLKNEENKKFSIEIINLDNNKWIDIPDSYSKTFIEYANTSKQITLDEVPALNIRSCGIETGPKNVVFQFEIEVEVYYFTCYDILEQILKQYRKKTQTTTKDYLFELPTSGELYDLLTTTIPPTMVFTQSTVFDAVNEIFKLFDAIFTIDENNVLGIEYFNDINKENKQIKISGRSIALSGQGYNNALLTYYQNAIAKDSFPKKDFAPMRSVGLGIPTTDTMAFITPHNIDYLIKMVALYEGVEGGVLGRLPAYEPSVGSIPVYGKIELDITPFVYEEQIYGLLPENVNYPIEDSYYNKSKNGCIYYTKNSKNIAVFSQTYTTIWGITYNSIEKVYSAAWHRFFGFRNTYYNAGTNSISGPNFGVDYSKYFFRVEYLANINGRAKVETLENKYKGEFITNQSQGQINLEKLGLNLVGLSLKMGQPTLAMTHEITNIDERVEKGQIYIDSDNNVWVANVCTYTILDNNHLVGNIEFTKNFNALSLNVRVDQEKRLTNISNDLAVKCEDDYIEYVYFSQNARDLDQQEAILFNRSYLARAVKETFKPTNSLKPINTAYVNSYYDDETRINFSEKNLPAQQIYAPMVAYGFGNALCFEISFDSPISAGKQTSKSDLWYADKYFTIEYLYTDDNGWADLIDITFLTMDSTFTQNFPHINDAIQSATDVEICCNISKLEYLKKPNEIFALNYELIFLPTPDKINVDFIGNAFISNNAAFRNLKERKLYLHYETTSDFKYSVLDLKGNMENVIEVDDVVIINNNTLEIQTALTTRPFAWSLCDEEGNILFASNECLTFNDGAITLYLITRQKRL